MLSVIAAVTVAAAVAAAGVTLTVMMVVVVALHVGIVEEIALDQCLHRRIGIAADTAKEADACRCKRHLCAAADTAADQNVGAQALEDGGESAVSLSVGINDRGGDDRAVCYVVDLELLRVTEVLENLSVFVCYCNFHFESPFCRVFIG